jgi:hypothetical protein
MVRVANWLNGGGNDDSNDSEERRAVAGIERAFDGTEGRKFLSE